MIFSVSRLKKAQNRHRNRNCSFIAKPKERKVALRLSIRSSDVEESEGGGKKGEGEGVGEKSGEGGGEKRGEGTG